MSKPVRIDVVSDVVCPWCFIGKKRLEQAVA
ncbi:MAG: DsbA family protein, partial [Rhodomicrobium sp.]